MNTFKKLSAELANKKVGAAFISGLMLVALGCSRELPEDKKKKKQNIEDTNPFGETATQNDPSGKAGAGDDGDSSNQTGFNFDRVAIRNYEELKTSIGAVTCVKDTDRIDENGERTYGQFFNEVSGNLPTTNDPSKYIAAHIVGSMNLASQACKLSIMLPSASQCEWSAGLRDSNNPDDAFTDENIDALGRGIAEHFWGMEAANIDAASPFLADLKLQVDSLRKEVGDHLEATNVNQNQRDRRTVEGVLISLCSAALSSSHFTTY